MNFSLMFIESATGKIAFQIHEKNDFGIESIFTRLIVFIFRFFLSSYFSRYVQCGDGRLSGDAENAGLENAGLENAGPNRRGGNRRTGKRRTSFAGVENAGLENTGT